MEQENAQLEAFRETHLEPGESILAWVEADEGVAVLTERRLSLCTGGAFRSVPVTEPALRYLPSAAGDALVAWFETEAATLEFRVGAPHQASLGNLLGNIAELREAHRYLEESGLDPNFVSPPAGPGGAGVSAIYQLMRLKELVNQGLLTAAEFLMHRLEMRDRLREQGAGRG